MQSGELPVEAQHSPLTVSPSPCTDLILTEEPVIIFGCGSSSHVLPYSITIFSDGRIMAEGNVKITAQYLSPSTVKALVQLASSEGLWTLPEDTGSNALSDTAPLFVSINLSYTIRSVAADNGSTNNSFINSSDRIKQL
jgi:hypothetical protein